MSSNKRSSYTAHGFGLALSLLFLAPAAALGQTISWDANTEANVAGYVVVSGTAPGSYNRLTDTGLRTTLAITGVDVYKNNYFAVQAYTSDGRMSGFSQEVLLPAIPPPVDTAITGYSANASLPLLMGTPVTWSATAASGAGPVEYKFVLFRERAGWTVMQDYGPSGAFTWTPGWGDIGKAALQVWVRTIGTTAPYEAWRGTDLFDVNTAPARLTADTSFPSPAGQPVIWTAQIAGTTGALEYRFLLLDQATATWSVLREYGPSHQVTWVPARNGKYALQVWARRVGSQLPYEIWTGTGEFPIQPSTLVVTAVDVDRALPSPIGTPVTWTARTSGGTAGPLEFKFLRYSAQSTLWTVVQNYSTSRAYTWTPTWGDEGSYLLQVWARNGGSTTSYDAWLPTKTFEIQPAQLQLTSNSVFPVPPSATVLWTASVPDPSLSLEYSFFLYDRSKGTWSNVRPYGPGNTFAWTPGNAGSYALQVWARRKGSTAAYEVWRGTEYLEVSSSPARMTSLTTASALPGRSGTPVTWTATASGGTTTALEYRFVLYSASSGWRIVSDYSASRTLTWTPGVQDAETHALQVWVRSVGSTAAYEDWRGTGFFEIRP